MKKIIIFLGAPGAGKGTAAGAVAPKLNARHVSTGAMLRDAVARKTPAGVEAEGYMKAGGLVPDAVLCKMIAELLAETAADTTLFFDGFPRTLAQAEALETLAKDNDAIVKCAVLIDAPQEILLERMGGRRVCPKCGAGYHVKNLPPKKEGICDACGAELITRADDQPATIRHRLEVYETSTAPVIDFYRKADKVVAIDGSQDAAVVADAVFNACK